MATVSVASDDRSFRNLAVHEDEGKDFYIEGADRPFDLSAVNDAKRGGDNKAAVSDGVRRVWWKHVSD